jgi:serine/threonine protein kinase
MTPTAVESFMSTLRRSNLLSPEQVAVAADLATRSDAVGVARDLILRTWLTEWQARQLLAGKSKLFLGKYKLLDVLGQGGMGAVLKAESVTLRREVALKVMATNLHGDTVARARFEREIAFSASLNHPNIVRAIDADQIGDRCFLVMEYFPGRDLKALIREPGQVSIEFACECIRQAANGLQHAHERGIVHRDIKPSNLLVTKDPKTRRSVIKLLDLGLARLSHQADLVTQGGDDFQEKDADVTRSGQIMGSPDYMSPEQAMSSRTVDIRSDIYGLGVTLFQLLCGELPYSGDNVMEKLLARINTDAPPVSKFRHDVPPVLVHIVARMLHRDPAQRFQTPAEVAAVLEAFVTEPKSLEIQPEPETVPAIDLPTLDSRVDETLNFFVDHLDSRAAITPAPLLRRRVNQGTWPLAISVGTACAVVIAVLFALSQGSGPPEKKESVKPALKTGADEKTPFSGAGANSQTLESPARTIPFLPPGKQFAIPDDSLVQWARRVAREIRVDTSSGESVVKPTDPLPKASYTVIGIDLSGVQLLSSDNLKLIVSNPSLRHLNLSGCRLKDTQLRQIARLKELRFLDLGNTLITDEGLGFLTRCRNLTSLGLRYDSIGDQGLASLNEIATLADLDLEGTNVTNKVVDSLAALRNLRRLNLKRTALTEDAVSRLRVMLPDCSIEH